MKPTGTEKIILSGGAGPLAGWLALRISLEFLPRAALIGPSSSSTIKARTTLSYCAAFSNLGVVGVSGFRAFFSTIMPSCSRTPPCAPCWPARCSFSLLAGAFRFCTAWAGLRLTHHHRTTIDWFIIMTAPSTRNRRQRAAVARPPSAARRVSSLIASHRPRKCHI